MSERQWVILLFGASFICCVAPILYYFGRLIKNALVKDENLHIHKRKSFNFISFSLFLIISIWILRFAVGYFSKKGELTGWEELFNSFIHALQTFSMDESYTDYIGDGKNMIKDIFADWNYVKTLENAYGIYASILNAVAPVVGGAIIFEIIASVFPRIKHFFLELVAWKEKLYFSELNEASIELATDLLDKSEKKSMFTRPVVVFTDSYIDKKVESDAELIQKAKSIGAICIKDDLSHFFKVPLGKKKYFLIDPQENSNLKSLVDLASGYNFKYIKNSQIFYFVETDAYIRVEASIRDAFKGKKESKIPTFIPIRSYRNLVSNLLWDIPLYEPIVEKKKKQMAEKAEIEKQAEQKAQDGEKDKSKEKVTPIDMNVTIIGFGNIGKEMLLSVYWFGQMLDCNLRINVISQKSEEDFYGELDFVNPEIRRTFDPADSILRYNRKGGMSPRYCEVKYYSYDVKSVNFMKLLQFQEKGDNTILDSDYVLVSLGSDEDNMSVATTLRNYIGQYHIERKKDSKTVITYVVYNSDISEKLNQECRYFFIPNKDDMPQSLPDIYMRAVGSLRDIYCVRNIMMTDHIESARDQDISYLSSEHSEALRKIHKDRMKNQYEYWASMARSLHIKYKIFSLGFIEESLFTLPGEDTDIDSKEYMDAYEKAKAAFKEYVSGDKAIQRKKGEPCDLDRLAWLEHRRWAAFLRTQGFRQSYAYETYSGSVIKSKDECKLNSEEVGMHKRGAHKQMTAKLHPCLVECDPFGIKCSEFGSDEKPEEYPNNKPRKLIGSDKKMMKPADTDMDFLDELTYDLYNLRYIYGDFKVNDYPWKDIAVKKTQEDKAKEKRRKKK